MHKKCSRLFIGIIFFSILAHPGNADEFKFPWISKNTYPYKMNGVVFNLEQPIIGDLAGSNPCCDNDDGFKGAQYVDFVNIDGSLSGLSDDLIPKLALIGIDENGGTDIEKIYIGMHVAGDDKLNHEDMATLYFDANNNGKIDVGDFALLFELWKDGEGEYMENTKEKEECRKEKFTTATGDACEFDVAYPKVYIYNPAYNYEDDLELCDPNSIPTTYPWQTKEVDFTNSGQQFVQYALAFDYNATNGKSQLWEFELEIDIAKLNALLGTSLSVTKGQPGFRLGVRLTESKELEGGTSVWKWPQTLELCQKEDHELPNEDSVHEIINENKLAQITFMNDSADICILSDLVTTKPAPFVEDSAYALQVYIPKDSDFSGETLPEKYQTTFKATIKLKHTASGTAPIFPPEGVKGKINFYIRPWSGSTCCGYLMGTRDFTFTSFDDDGKDFEIKWPMDRGQFERTAGVKVCDMNPNYAGTECPDCNHVSGGKYPRDKIFTTNADGTREKETSHACYFVAITDRDGHPLYNTYPIFDLSAGDTIQKNLTYVGLSEYIDKFLIEAGKEEGVSGSEKTEFIIKVDPKNIPYSYMSDNLKSMWGIRSFSIDTTVISGDPGENRMPGEWDKWQIQFTNGNDLGLNDLGKGYFSLFLDPGEEKQVEVKIMGGSMPFPAVKVELSPKAGANVNPSPDTPPEVQALKERVDPGQEITIIANGKININPTNANSTFNGPNGKIDPSLRTAPFRLTQPNPWMHAGAVIGSFESNLTNSFVIGSDSTFIVPAGKQYLYVAVNDVPGKFDDNVGKDALSGFTLHIIKTGPERPPYKYFNPANKKNGLTKTTTGGNLPTFDFIIYKVKRNLDNPNRMLLIPRGYVRYAAYESHPVFHAHPFELTLPYCGWTFLDSRFNLNGGFSVGTKLGYFIFRPGAVSFYVEADIGCTFAQDASQNLNFLLNAILNIKTYLNFIQNFPIQNLAYYIIAGGGYTALFNAAGFVSDSPAYNVGIGLNLPLSMRFGLMLEGRCIFIQNLLGVGMTFNPQVVAGLVWRF